MKISDAQREMRFAYYGGAMGMFTSAAVWLTAGVVCARIAPERAIWVLFVGGVFIHPISVVLNKAMGRPARHGSENPLGALVFASTIWMILCLPLAYAASRLHIEWFFPAMLFVIGGRYLTFSTIFGARLYWVCGITLAAAGYVLARMYASPELGAFTGAAIEAAFASAIFASNQREAVA
jgi:hypothetical protein